MDAVEDLSPVRRAVRQIRSRARCRCALTRQKALEAELMAEEIVMETTSPARLTTPFRIDAPLPTRRVGVHWTFAQMARALFTTRLHNMCVYQGEPFLS